MNIIITGASNGIGYYTALNASQKPGTRILAVSRNERKLMELKLEMKKINPAANINILSMDVADFNAEHFKAELKKINFDSVEMLINNAGSLINKPFEELSEDDWLNMYKVNVFGVVKIIKTLLPLMGKTNKTHIVNISSYGGFQGSAKFPGLSGYSSGKAALANLTECLAEEFKNKNISVNCLALGAVQTEMFKKAFPGNNALTSPQQMAKFIVDFTFDGHNYFNGKILPVTLSTI
jgi:short-subunit dehydrogenase